MLKLHFRDQSQADRWLTEDSLLLGSGATATLQLQGQGISAEHARLEHEGGHYYLSDCGSEKGTYVNGERIGSRYQLRAGDVLRLGLVELELSDPNQRQVRSHQPALWSLQVMQGEGQGKKFPLKGSLTLGRSVKCDACFEDPQLSRRHAEFFFRDGVLEVKDLGSANGILVNQKKVAAASLQPGDLVQMGGVLLLVIGPKVSVQAHEEEDATLFMKALDLPKPVAQPVQSGRVEVPQMAAKKPAAAEPVSSKAPLLLGLSVLVLVIAAGVALLA